MERADAVLTIFTFIADMAVATAALILILLAAAVEWRRQPYTARDFSLAMDRICRGVEELWRVQDLALFTGWEDSATKHAALRRLCQGMLRDMLRNTVYILERAVAHPEGGEVVRRGTRLIFRLRWGQVLLFFHRENESFCAITAEMAEEYAGLWSEVVQWIETRVIDGCARVGERRCRRHTGAGERAAL